MTNFNTLSKETLVKMLTDAVCSREVFVDVLKQIQKLNTLGKTKAIDDLCTKQINENLLEF